MTARDKTPTRDSVAAAGANLEHAVLALRASDAWRRNLAVMARFHRYSWHNQLLIGAQRPDATFVRGFKAWLSCGRAVRKGERGIAIFAPRPWSRPKTDECGDEDLVAGISFAVVYVFDVAQTDPLPGHPAPWHPPRRHAAVGDEALARALWDAMLAHAASLGLTVSTTPDDPLTGPATYRYYRHDTRAIWVRPDRALPDMAATLAHELVHAATHDAAASLPRDVREVIAESVACIACERFGLDLSLRSTHYVAAWLDDPAAFRLGMAAIHDAAASLIDAIEAAMLAVGVSPLAA